MVILGFIDKIRLDLCGVLAACQDTLQFHEDGGEEEEDQQRGRKTMVDLKY